MYAAVDRLAASNRTAIVFIDHYGHRRDYTYTEVADWTARYAFVLRALGVREEDRVALCNANTQRCLFMVLALERLGAKDVVCSEDLNGEALLEQLASPPVSALVTNRRRRPSVEWVQERLPERTLYMLVGEEHDGWARMDTLVHAAKNYRDVHDPDTAAPADVAHAAVDVLELRATDRVWSTLPFGSPSWRPLALAPFYAGGCAIVHERSFDVRECADILYEADATVLCGPAAHFEALLEEGRGERLQRLPHLRRCVALGASGELCARWEERTGKALQAAEYAP